MNSELKRILQNQQDQQKLLQNQLTKLKEQLNLEMQLLEEREEFRKAIDCPPLMAELMGYNLVDKIHYDIWDRIKNRTKPHVLLLMHRHSIKSTVFNYVDNVCRILKNPYTTGLLYSATHIISKSQLDAVKQLIENNKYLKKFGLNLVGKTWTKEYIRIAGVEGKLADNVYTLETGGVDKSLTAKHFDFIKIDDVQNETNYKHTRDRENVIEKFRAIFNLQKRDYSKTDKWACEIFVIGTRYHPKDVYQVIIDELTDLFEIIIVPASKIVNGIEVPCLQKIYPDMSFLNFVRKEIGDYGYECQMNQNPHFKINKCLDWNKISVIPDIELNDIFDKIKNNKIPETQLALILDPAEEIEKNSNYSALSMLYYDGNVLNILRVWKMKNNLDEVVKLIVDVIKEFGIKYFYCEKSGLETNIRFFLNKKLSEIGMANYVSVEAVSHGKEAKNSRIIALQPLIEDNKVRRAKSFIFQPNPDEQPLDMFKELEKEISTFPTSNVDDMLDTIAYSLRQEIFDISTNFIIPDVDISKKIFDDNEQTYSGLRNIDRKNRAEYVEFI